MKKIILTIVSLLTLTTMAGEMRLTPPDNVMINQQWLTWQDSKFWTNWKPNSSNVLEQAVRIGSRDNKGIQRKFYLVAQDTNTIMYTTATITWNRWSELLDQYPTNTAIAEEVIMGEWRDSVKE